MKRHFLAVAIAFFANPSFALDASSLAHNCRNDLLEASNYINGWLDKYRDDEMILEGVLKSDMQDKPEKYAWVKEAMIGNFCVPDGANIARAIVIACDWVKTHPEKGEIPASRAIMQAFNAAWPCQ